jgi:hypothetical protein
LEPYIKIEEGEMFGHTDLANNKTFKEYVSSFKRKLSSKSIGKKKLMHRELRYDDSRIGGTRADEDGALRDIRGATGGLWE